MSLVCIMHQNNIGINIIAFNLNRTKGNLYRTSEINMVDYVHVLCSRISDFYTFPI